jgi:tRNA dimethylallyltransferase
MRGVPELDRLRHRGLPGKAGAHFVGAARLTQLFLIAGPTASGKTALALRLAEQVGGEIVNADALQVYRDLRILSARPSPEDEARVPHHLFGVVDAAEAWSVGRWLAAAETVLKDIAARGKPAVAVGGTGLYFRALTQGLVQLPGVPAEVRQDVQAQFDGIGEATFREALRAIDPPAEARIAPGDRQRLTRALEVFEATGRALSDWQADAAPPFAKDFRAVVLEPPRAELYARCDARFSAMIDAGALDEVRALLARGLDPSLPAMKAVGVRELGTHLRGELVLAEAIAQAQQVTRRYAKRQLTWFRHQAVGWPRLDAADPEGQWGQFIALNPTLTLS